jgi:hypothetical protein
LAAAEFFKAERMEIQVGTGNIGSAATPLRLNTGINGLSATSGLALKLAAASSSASLRETSGSLRLILPTAFSATSALTVPGDLNLTVTDGDLLNATGAAINPVNTAVLAEQDALFKITGSAAIAAATAEMARQDSFNYNDYWTTYRGWTKGTTGVWAAPATAKHTENSFTFTDTEKTNLKSSKGFSDSAVTAYQAQLNAIHQLYRTSSYDPAFVYSRPAADQQAALDQRVVGTNAYYSPLASDLYRLLFPKQAEQRCDGQ